MIKNREQIYEIGKEITEALAEHVKQCSGCRNCEEDWGIKNIFEKIPVTFDHSEYIEAFWMCVLHDAGEDEEGNFHGCEYAPKEQHKCIWCVLKKQFTRKYKKFRVKKKKHIRWYELNILSPFRSFYFDLEEKEKYEMRKKGWLTYKKKPLEVQAIQMDKDFTVETLEGTMKGKKDDYLIIGIMGEKYPCTKVVFEKSYDLEE